MLTFKQIEAFVLVADLGSFRRAADRLNTTQPNISNRIAQVEASLGVVVMERDAGSVRLTPKGAALLEAARGVLAAVDGFVAAAGDDALFDGTLRLGVSELVAHTWLRDWLRAMKARFANVTVELTVDLSANLSDGLFSRELDLVFQNGPFDRATRGEVALGQSEFGWVAAAGATLSARPTAQEMAGQPILTHARRTAPFRQMEAHFRGLGLVARLVPSSNIAACLQMTLDGLGIACLPRAMVERPLALGQLMSVEYGWRPAPLRFAARFDLDPVPGYLHAAVDLARDLFPEDQVS